MGTMADDSLAPAQKNLPRQMALYPPRVINAGSGADSQIRRQQELWASPPAGMCRTEANEMAPYLRFMNRLGNPDGFPVDGVWFEQGLAPPAPPAAAAEVVGSAMVDSPGLWEFLHEQGLQNGCFVCHIASNYWGPDRPSPGKGKLKKWLKALSFLDVYTDASNELIMRPIGRELSRILHGALLELSQRAHSAGTRVCRQCRRLAAAAEYARAAQTEAAGKPPGQRGGKPTWNSAPFFLQYRPE